MFFLVQLLIISFSCRFRSITLIAKRHKFCMWNRKFHYSFGRKRRIWPQRTLPYKNYRNFSAYSGRYVCVLSWRVITLRNQQGSKKCSQHFGENQYMYLLFNFIEWSLKIWIQYFNIYNIIYLSAMRVHSYLCNNAFHPFEDIIRWL